MNYSKSKTKAINFPLGGIGTGCIGLCGNGRFQDWEIFNRPSKGSYNGSSHFAVKAEWKGKSAVKVLNGDLETDLAGFYSKTHFGGFGFGPAGASMAGFSHFEKHDFTSDFPFATLHFSDREFPCRMKLEAFNPFIPCDSYNSSLPGAFFTVSFENTEDTDMDVTAVLSVRNPYPASRNKAAKKNGFSAVTLSNPDVKCGTGEGNITIGALGNNTGAQEYWYRGIWNDAIVTFRRQLDEGDLPERHYDTDGKNDTASVYAKTHIPAKGRTSMKFLIAWYNPYGENYWDKRAVLPDGSRALWKNWYSTVFDSSLDIAKYCARHFNTLRRDSRTFARAFSSSTLPDEIKEVINATLTVLKSPTVLRVEDGSIWGWEGAQETEGSCEGSCTHVWNYAYALCYLFPDLERGMRENDFKYNLWDNGMMRFRLTLPMTREGGREMACVDGQMGGVIKTYRDWKLSGDTEWMKKLWPSVKKSLDYATSDKNPFRWDADRDGVLEGRQHHTLDMELFGPSAWLEGFYLAALKAAAEMAEVNGDRESAAEYSCLYEKGRNFTEKELFNGRYYIQKLNLADKDLLAAFDEGVVKQYWNYEAQEIKYQICEGSDIDQLCAQWHACLCGLGDIFDKDHRRKALEYMFGHNFKKSFRNYDNIWRIFALNDEAGTVICDYDGVYKPALPVPYTDECMTGFEYQFAGLLLSEEYVDCALEIVRSIRSRYDGEKRNPFNEIECGSNYVRALASFALLPIYSGFTYDYTKHSIGFSPVGNPEIFAAPFGIGGAFCTIRTEKGHVEITVLKGVLKLSELSLPGTVGPVLTGIADGLPMNFKTNGNTVIFDGTTVIQRKLVLMK